MIRMIQHPESTRKEWVKVADGIPVRGSLPRHKSPDEELLCRILVVVTGLVGLVGCFAALSSDPKDEETGYRLLRVAKASGDVAKSVCNC